jgi:hypothetical protein
MKAKIKILVSMMLLVAINIVSAQTSNNPLLVNNSNESNTAPAVQKFDVKVQNTEGIVYITWELPCANLEGFYMTERSNDGENYKPIALKHLVNLPENATKVFAIQYSLKDKTPVEGTVYYRFSKSNQQGDVLQSMVIPIDSDTPAVNNTVTANFIPVP